MKERFRPQQKAVEEMITAEQPVSILEIGDISYGMLMADIQYRQGIEGAYIDRMFLTLPEENFPAGIYRQTLTWADFKEEDTLPAYDFILITGLFETLLLEEAQKLLAKLLIGIKKQVMVITPEYAQNGKRTYHPVAFMGMDFAYTMQMEAGQNWQIYQFFAPVCYAPLAMDTVPRRKKVLQHMRIAFIIPHMGLTGGMKAIVAQIKLLTERGHSVKIFYRAEHAESALPQWSILTENDYAEQCVLALHEQYIHYMQNIDVVFLAWMSQMREFVNYPLPVVMWEQGFEWFYGDYKKPIASNELMRLNMHRVYRYPIHLLSVSHTNQKVLAGIYNRNTPYCPCGIDVDFYQPGEKHTGEYPLILLVGNPCLAFKGFKFAFDALETLWRSGERFQVKWAAQMGVKHGEISFPLEVLVGLSQQELVKLYASADIYFSTSLYESYPLPPLEAMACKTAVVAVDNGGIQCYAKDGENCLLCPQGDLQTAVSQLAKLLQDKKLRSRLEEAGRETAEEQSSKKTILQMEQSLSDIVSEHWQRLGKLEEEYGKGV